MPSPIAAFLKVEMASRLKKERANASFSNLKHERKIKQKNGVNQEERVEVGILSLTTYFLTRNLSPPQAGSLSP